MVSSLAWRISTPGSGPGQALLDPDDHPLAVDVAELEIDHLTDPQPGAIGEGWSSEQISGWLKSGAELGLCALAMETIYAFI